MIAAADRGNCYTISQIAVPLKACRTMAAEITAGSMLTGVLDLSFDKKKLNVGGVNCIDEILKDTQITEGWRISENERMQLGKSFCCGCDLPLRSSLSARETYEACVVSERVFSDPRPEPTFFGTCFQHQ